MLEDIQNDSCTELSFKMEKKTVLDEHLLVTNIFCDYLFFILGNFIDMGS